MSHAWALDVQGAWTLAGAISPRPRVRIAQRDGAGSVVSTFSSTAALTSPVPDVPWAVPLADSTGIFRLLCFDLDAHDGDVARVERDTRRLVELLDMVGADHLVCTSGPGGSRHVWLRVPEGIAADVARSLGRTMRALLPSLDITALSNPAAGCVRSPGSPHRAGGSSVPHGDAGAWARTAVSPAQVLSLLELAVREAGSVVAPGPEARPLRGVMVDGRGRRFIPGRKRDLPPRSAAVARAACGTDASRAAWSVLLGAARACWRFEDVAHLAFEERAPGLEHVRTLVLGGRRVPRNDKGRHLAHQWNRAVAQVASTPTPQRTTDGEFDARARAIAAAACSVLEAMATVPGRWRQGGGAADERVLRALVLFATQAVAIDVEADIRRLGLTCGISRETARQALWRLEADGWIRRVQEAEGAHGAVWSIDLRSGFHRHAEGALSQAHSAPLGTGSSMREGVIGELSTWLAVAGHDVFSPGGLGHSPGNALASAHSATSRAADPADGDLLALCTLAGLHASESTAGLLAGAHVAAATSGLAGVGRRRARRYRLERAVWGWWREELEWMKAPGRGSDRRRGFPGQGVLLAGPGARVPFPRVLGRASWRSAVAAVRAGAPTRAGEVWVRAA